MIYKTFAFYCMHYPHIVIYPALLFGFAGLFVLRAALLRWSVSRRAVAIRVVIAIAGAFFAMYYEATGGYMMLFEFNKDAQSATRQFQSYEVRQKTKALGIDGAFVTPMATQVSDALSSANGRSEIARILKNYSAWDGLDENWRSRSRAVYLTMFWYMIFVMLLGFSLLPRVRTRIVDKNLDPLMSINLAGAFLIFLMWIPFRIFYNHYTKIPIFGVELSDNFFGDLPTFTIGGITTSEVAPMLIFVTFVYFLSLRASDLSRKASIIVVISTSLFIAIVSTVLAIHWPSAFSAIYGLHGDVKYLCFRIVVLFLILLLTYDFISSKIDPYE